MHPAPRHTLLVSLALLLPLQAGWAASVKLRYGFHNGASYEVHELYHDVGSSTVEMEMMGQHQKMTTPIDQVSESRWNARVVGTAKGGGVRLAMGYGKQKGGERWAANAGPGSEKLFGDSSAEVTIDPLEGMTALTTKPAEPLYDGVYRGRFGWMPQLPEQALHTGDSFSHDYTIKGQGYTIKGSDEYTLEEIKDGIAYFDVESRQQMVIRYDNNVQGMGGPAMMSEMRLAYKGEGSASFDIKEGYFSEREMKLAYTTPKPSSGAFASTMRGVIKQRWEMERR